VPTARRAFGLDFECEIGLDGLPELDGVSQAPTRLTAVRAEALARDWPSSGAQRIVQEGEPGTALERFVDHHPQAGYHLAAGGFGEAVIAPDGRLVRTARGEAIDGRFERFLIGRVLPWTSLVRGIEVLHAAAVTVAGRAVILIGQSGAGKTSLAIQLVLAGAGFLTDDVLAVDRGEDGQLRAHPGARVAGLRDDERERLRPEDRAALGPLRPLDDKAYATLVPETAPVGLGAVFFLTRPGAGDGFAAAEPTVERLTAPPAQLLLSSTFVLGLRPPDRLANLLELCADIAATVPQYRIRIRTGEESQTTAAAIRSAL
jgi:hypothetical protein